MNLGAFSVSLTVKNLKASRDFYEALGFSVFGGEITQNYLIMKSGTTLIGLFQGMFDRNILTFNPGWDQNAKKLDVFPDVREIQNKLKEKGIKLEKMADDASSVPESITLFDPDGNPILIDQHV